MANNFRQVRELRTVPMSTAELRRRRQSRQLKFAPPTRARVPQQNIDLKRLLRQMDLAAGRLTGEWLAGWPRDIKAVRERQRKEAGILKGFSPTRAYKEILQALKGR